MWAQGGCGEQVPDLRSVLSSYGLSCSGAGVPARTDLHSTPLKEVVWGWDIAVPTIHCPRSCSPSPSTSHVLLLLTHLVFYQSCPLPPGMLGLHVMCLPCCAHFQDGMGSFLGLIFLSPLDSSTCVKSYIHVFLYFFKGIMEGR